MYKYIFRNGVEDGLCYDILENYQANISLLIIQISVAKR